MNRNISARDILGLAGSYLWALALILAGSLIGSFLAPAIAGALYGLISGDSMNLMRDVLKAGDPTMLGLPAQGAGYSTSWAGIIYTAGRYLPHLGIWGAFLLYLAVSKTSHPILKVLRPGYGGNTLRGLALGLGLGFALNGICILAAALSESIQLSFIGVNVLGLVLVFACVFIQSSAEEFAIRCYLFERTLRTCGSTTFSIVSSSALFALLHLTSRGASFVSCLNIFLVGAFFCLLVAKLRSPWTAFGCHTAWNFTQAVLFGLPNSGYTSPFALFGLASGTTPQAGFAYDPIFGIEASPLCGIIFAAACLALILYARRRNLEPDNIWAEGALPSVS